MNDEYGRTYQCPKCQSYIIVVVHQAFASKGRLHCLSCNYQGRHEDFRAIPEEAIKKHFNPTRR